MTGIIILGVDHITKCISELVRTAGVNVRVKLGPSPVSILKDQPGRFQGHGMPLKIAGIGHASGASHFLCCIKFLLILQFKQEGFFWK